MPRFYALLADLILVVHFAFVLWVVLGLVLVLLGRPLGWRWVGNRWVRLGHLASIGVVVAQAWLGRMCPLTIWESELRVAAGQQPYDPEGFVAHWVQRLLFFPPDTPTYYFVIGYTVFGLLIVASFFVVPVRWREASENRIDEN